MSQVLRIAGSRPYLFICFGGRGEGLHWAKRIEGLGVNSLHFQDSRARWYLDGADGFSSFDGVMAECREEIARFQGCRVIVFGQSFGGYAALRAASVLKPDRVIAFAPQTHYITHRSLYAKQRNYAVPVDIVDIRHALIWSHVPTSIYVSHTETENSPDAYFWDDHSHLVGLHGVPHIKINVLNYHSHPVALRLARDGKLNDCIEHEIAAIGASDGPVSTVLHSGMLS